MDPADSDGHRDAMQALLLHPRLQDPAPRSTGALVAAAQQGGDNTAHRGDPALDTADWRDATGPGNLRVDYVLPAATLKVTAGGVFWPAPGDPAHALLGEGEDRSRHHLVWVDIAWPPAVTPLPNAGAPPAATD